jgi:cyclase
VIPTLLLSGRGLVKTRRFQEPQYVGDPINAIRIFNEKEVDELAFLDIRATREGRGPDMELLAAVASECFMPLCYGGGLRDVGTINRVLSIGVEKVAIGAALAEAPEVVRDAAREHGSSTIVGVLDFKRPLLGGPQVYVRSGTEKTRLSLVDAAHRAEDLGCGELLVNSIERDGPLSGFDLEAIATVATAVRIPVIASGGAGSLRDLRAAVIEGQASAVAAGAYFVFVGKHRAVLITYPSQSDLESHVFPA